jgi:hypothetical protein
VACDECSKRRAGGGAGAGADESREEKEDDKGVGSDVEYLFLMTKMPLIPLQKEEIPARCKSVGFFR